MCRSRERLGTVRVSTAYGFYQAMEKHLVFNPDDYSKKEKNIFEATSYDAMYFAADANDELGKENITATLNRQSMWNCSMLKGSSTSYEFVGGRSQQEGQEILSMRMLPCPCEDCYLGQYDSCINRNIVGDMTQHIMTPVRNVECPPFLVAPLDRFTNSVLSVFISTHDKLPKKTTKADLVKHINDNLRHLVVDMYGNINVPPANIN